MGGIAEYEMRKRERLTAYYVQQPIVVRTPATVLTTTPVVTQAVQQPAQPVTVVNNYYGTGTAGSSAMTGANALFGR
jgi:hypothetical protein